MYLLYNTIKYFDVFKWYVICLMVYVCWKTNYGILELKSLISEFDVECLRYITFDE